MSKSRLGTQAGYLHFSRWKASFEGTMPPPTGQAVQLGPRGATEPSQTAWAQLERCRQTEAGARFAWDWDDSTPETAFFRSGQKGHFAIEASESCLSILST
ncbi:hypothetical protein AK812_SmicGene5972 [Symbiodinium microadriaticum]|uniref:Uncharacterized protein n=1 Tax=Symbiodinium microadriaticum TaxID=2951 RepID=A0A1Q9ES47_SYMMI|nr:hypothetical protein AK812_SmicGene5972 [Symbiodinium microadriaticum]